MSWETKANLRARIDSVERYNSYLQEEIRRQHGKVMQLRKAMENTFTNIDLNAVEAKQVATQEKQRARTQQEQQTMEAQQEAERKKIAAEAAAEVQRIQADAAAYEIKTKADAEAEANEKIALTITTELIDYTQALNWNGELPATFVGANDVIPVIQPEKAAVEGEAK